ncbi:MAG TPA: hypothetical protein VFW87_25100 [Pirellulales bacterium]|nr:hypothetical protein [Pirellulales bacterium]
MNRARTSYVAACLAMLTGSALLAGSAAQADDVQYVTENGVKYQVITQTNQRPITETRYEPREQTVLRERYTTQLQDSVRTYQVPVTEQQWVLGYSRTWNIFAPPVPSYRLMPVTRWETRTETVKIPITKREYVQERQVQHVPVTDTKIAQETTVRRVAIGMEGAAAAAGRADNVARSNDAWSGTNSLDDPAIDNTPNPTVDRRR